MQSQIQSYEIKRQEMFHQAYLLQRELDRISNATKFDLSYQSREEYEILK
jgi:hypothetical protein